MTKDNFIYLNHILKCIKRIEQYTTNISFDDLINNNMLQDAVIRQIEIIGEAASRVSKDFKDKYKEIPWIDMKDMRNKLIHDYFGVNTKHVWNVIQQDITPLKNQITGILVENNVQINIDFNESN